MRILGINSVYHESAAALVVDGEVLAACEEERFTGIKHAKEPSPDNPHRLPEHAIRCCLDQAGVDASAIDLVVYSFDPRLRRAKLGADWAPDPIWEETFLQRLEEVGPTAEKVLGRSLRGRLKFVPHHLAHAASAYYPSGFERAAILVIDGIGEAACSTLARGEGARIRTIETIWHPHSLGFLWEMVSMHLGFSRYDAAKVMGLAAYGDAKRFAMEFASIVRLRDGGYEINPKVLWLGLGPDNILEALFGPARTPGSELLGRHAHVAAGLQAATNGAVIALLRQLTRKAPFEHLCVAGGVALNCVTNTLIKQSQLFADVFIPSAAHDAGTAIGAALAADGDAAARRGRHNATPYLGPQFRRREILAAIKTVGLTPRHSMAPARDAADMIAEGRIVGWFQGRMEFGPRALGNRSLLADPRRWDMRDVINRKIKHREAFRPFAPSVLAEHAYEWFDVGSHSQSDEFMLFACPVKNDRRDLIPAVVHRDGTARVQLVRREANPRFHALISRFFSRTGVPLVLNTSFNDNEPIVCTPADAIATFRNTGLDALFMGNIYLTAKRRGREVNASRKASTRGSKRVRRKRRTA
jgi:carbamoyltransferase